jgi:hypothetical protein
MRTSFVLLSAIFLTMTEFAFSEPRDGQTVAIGPWTLATNYKADTFESCTMSRSAGELGIKFVRASDGLLLILDSPKWKLSRGRAYPIRLIAGSRSVDAQALAEAKSVTIALEDGRLNSRLRLVNIFEVRGEGATLRVPLEGSSAAFARLESCFNKHDTSDTNPFVASSRKP